MSASADVRKPRWLRLLISIDQFFNVLILDGDEDETISSNAGKSLARGERWARVLCRFLDLFQRGHCTKSIELDEGLPFTPP